MAEVVWRTQQEIDQEQEAQAWASLRARRDAILAACDWTQLPDVPLSPEDRGAWQVYRQALRDITEKPGAPFDVTWPEPPQVQAQE